MGAEVKGFQDAAREAGRGAADYAAKRLMPADAYSSGGERRMITKKRRPSTPTLNSVDCRSRRPRWAR